ncbi:hypothetical protein [Hymenobacter convexus]|uniref:hypothetical protein n=1 Tax=Hymenobacter sp. CA1UV-4 TaxID=3063782 RepID=UPI002714467D|nr:hypothetical protein [Hymenobacter sp. CA1UV-4]MDO7854411.1 hypothetical protein [Hymenobacter sp. CA1UV-4]
MPTAKIDLTLEPTGRRIAFSKETAHALLLAGGLLLSNCRSNAEGQADAGAVHATWLFQLNYDRLRGAPSDELAQRLQAGRRP